MIAGRSRNARILGGIGLYAAVGAYVIFALFPLFWTLKISVTPQSLLYSEGITLWPSISTWENYKTVLRATDFPALLPQQRDRFGDYGRPCHSRRLGRWLCHVAVFVPGQDHRRGNAASDPDLSAGHGDPADLSHHGSAWAYQ